MRKHFIFETSGGELIKCSGPSSYDSMTIAELIKLHSTWKTDDMLEAFSIVYNVDYTMLNKSRGNIDEIYEGIVFVNSDPGQLPLKDYLEFGGKHYKIPDVTKASIGQHILLRRLAQSRSRFEMIPVIAAVIMQPIIDKAELDHSRINYFIEEFSKMNVPAIYPIANFFYLRRRSFGKAIRNALSRPRILQMRLLKRFQNLRVVHYIADSMATLILLIPMLQSSDLIRMKYLISQLIQ